MMSPRRSSRARGTQPPPSAPTHTNSSNSSVSSGRQERSTRSSQKQTSPRRSNPRSQSIDDDDVKIPSPRRTRSGHEDIKEQLKYDKDEDNDEDEEVEEDEAEEEEVTRCICGQSDYPGLPAPVQEQLKQQAKSPDAKYKLEVINDDLGGLFVQCDICKVWQHGGCVGILDETAANRDDYFCEECRKDLHKIFTAPNGIRYSTYVPLKEEGSPEESPEPTPRDRSRRNADSKNKQSLEPPKRRSTMNSREIYDEAEEFRRAIEESKRDTGTGEGVRRKRGRDENEETKAPIKRQRTGSKSGSPEADKAATSSSDEALAIKASIEHTPKKNIRGAAARNHAAKELREQKERDRLKAVETRKSRMERRRGDESDGAEEPQPTPQSNISTPPAPDSSAPRSQNKKSKATGKSTKRTGRNQYTKDRDLPTSGLSNSLDPHAADTRNTRARSRSRSVARDNDSLSGAGHLVNGGFEGSGGRFSKVKHLNPNRTTMNEMKKRIAAIMEYVNRAEDEMNRQSSINTETSINGSGGSIDSASTSVPDQYKSVAVTGADIDFGALTSKEMVRVLKARLVAWEDEYGRYPR